MFHIKRLFFKIYHRFFNAEMVQYWKYCAAQRARVYTDTDGTTKMDIYGEKYPFPGYPRGHLLFGSLSPLKHEIKNKIFNEGWEKLGGDVAGHFRLRWPEIVALIENARFDMVPPEKMCVAVRELYRAFSEVENRYPSKNILALRDCLTFILQEDDGYRFRVQWLVGWFPFFFKPKLKHFDLALSMLEHGEMIEDMKERVVLLRKVLMAILEDAHMKRLCEEFLKEVNWGKVKLSKADRYFFRAKYFKVDYDRGNEY